MAVHGGRKNDFSLFSSWSVRSSSYNPHLHQLKIWFLALIHVHWGMEGMHFMPFRVFVRVVTMRNNVKKNALYILCRCPWSPVSRCSLLFHGCLCLLCSLAFPFAPTPTPPHFPWRRNYYHSLSCISLHFEFVGEVPWARTNTKRYGTPITFFPPHSFLLTEKAHIFCCAFLVTPSPLVPS